MLQVLSNSENLTKLATERNLNLQYSIFANQSHMQQLKFDNEKELKEKFEFIEKKDDYEKIEEDVVQSIINDEKIPLIKEEIEYEEPKVQNVEEIKEDKKNVPQIS